MKVRKEKKYFLFMFVLNVNNNDSIFYFGIKKYNIYGIWAQVMV